MARGAQPSASLLLFSLGLVLLYFASGSTIRLAEGQVPSFLRLLPFCSLLPLFILYFVAILAPVGRHE
uniref:Uncharacterized protein n=1 Tax=Arundo donax TaxID=35708 RepID=A0A0A9DF84_ARUDO